MQESDQMEAGALSDRVIPERVKGISRDESTLSKTWFVPKGSPWRRNEILPDD